MASKGPTAQEEKAILVERIAFWYVGKESLVSKRKPKPWKVQKIDGNLTFYRQIQGNVYEPVETDAILHELQAASLPERDQGFSAAAKMSLRGAHESLDLVKTLLLEGSDIVDTSNYVFDEPVLPLRYCDTTRPCLKNIRIDPMQAFDGIGRTLTVMKRNCPDYDADTDESRNFTRLMTWIGMVLAEQRAPKVFLVLYGKGSDGKTTLMEFLQEMLGSNIMTINNNPDSLNREDGPMDFKDKRVVHYEEPSRGHLVTENLKRIAGSQIITGRQLYKTRTSFPNYACIVFTTNKRPRMDGSTASVDRLRVCELGSIPKDERMSPEEAKNDLKKHWHGIALAAIDAFQQNGREVLEMNDEDLEHCVDDFFLNADAFIAEHFEFQEGAFMPKRTIAAMLKNSNVSIHDIEARLKKIAPKDKSISYCKQRIEGALSARPWGYTNVGLKADSYFSALESYKSKWKRGS